MQWQGNKNTLNKQTESNKTQNALQLEVMPKASSEVQVSDSVNALAELPVLGRTKLQNVNLETLMTNLGNCLSIVDDVVMKGYITKLEQLQIIPQEEDSFKALKQFYFFKITELVYEEDELSVDKLAMVFQVLSDKPCTLALMLKSDGKENNFYLGVRANGESSTGTLREALEQSLTGFFVGSHGEKYLQEELETDLKELVKATKAVSSVTCVADHNRQKESMTNAEFIQGIEKLVYAMRGKRYTAVFLADNLSYDELMEKKRDYENIYTQLSPFASMQINFSEAENESKTTSNTEGATKNISLADTKGNSLQTTKGTVHTEGTSENESTTEGQTDTHTDTQSTADGKTHTDTESEMTTEGTSVGLNIGGNSGTGKSFGGSLGISYIASAAGNAALNYFTGGMLGGFLGKSHSVSKGNSVSDSISKTLTKGISDSHSKSLSKTKGTGKTHSDSESNSISEGENRSQTYSQSVGFNVATTLAVGSAFGSSKAVTLNLQNMTLNMMMQKLKKHLERIEECESYGMWNFAAYFLGESAAETETAANIYRSLVAGTDSGIERNALNTWNSPESVKLLMPYLTHFVHPEFGYQGANCVGIVTPCALVSTKELAIQMGLPKHSVIGLPVLEHAAFGREVVTGVYKNENDKTLCLGKVFNMGESTDTEIDVQLNSLPMHTFVTGSTGAGKSNAVYHLLSEARRHGVNFLVIEPAKGEYKKVFSNVPCFGTNPKEGRLLKINPFSFPENVHVLEHIDRIVEIFNVCWPMYAAMPVVLKESIENAYKSAGWDLDSSENKVIDGLFPTFDDVLRELEHTINSSKYSADTKSDYIGSLATRLRSLTNGINGRVFVSDEMSLEELFDRSAIVDISRVGSTETKSLIMGMLVLKLQEYRMSQATAMNMPLKHLTVLEEAHNILKKTSTEQSAESSNVVGKSVEMLTSAIAEMRTYGEGFVIVDQAPNLLDTAAIRNTNTKIVLRLPESRDREITGGAIALKEEKQFNELSKLPTGVAAVYQNNWQEAVLCALPKFTAVVSQEREPDNTVTDLHWRKTANNELLRKLLKHEIHEGEIESVKRSILRANVPAKVRIGLIKNLKTRNSSYEWAVADFVARCYNLGGVLADTCKDTHYTFEDLRLTMLNDLKTEFEEFSEVEMMSVLYYVCMVKNELYPDKQLWVRLRQKCRDLIK